MADATRSSSIDLRMPVGPDDHAVGPADAPVTLLEYGDYECPDCFNAQPVVAALREELGDRLRVVFRHFPQSSIHPGASAAALAAEAAGMQGKFWEMHEVLFRKQRELADQDLTHLALRVNVELYRFERDLGADAHARRIRADLDSGTRSGVRGTPTFFINGHKYTGPVNVLALKEAIQAVVKPA